MTFLLTIIGLVVLFVIVLGIVVFLYKFENDEFPRPPAEPTLSEDVRALIGLTTLTVRFSNDVNAWLVCAQRRPGETHWMVKAMVPPHASFSEWQVAMSHSANLHSLPVGVYHTPQI